MTSSFGHERCYAFGALGNRRELKLPPVQESFAFAKVVASAGGLVCLHCVPRVFVPPQALEYYFLVGNPLTWEWTEIPALQWKHTEEAATINDFAMFVDDGSGFFKLGVHHSGAAAMGHTGYVYDSATRVWSALGMLHFSQAHVKERTKKAELLNMNLGSNTPTFPGMDDFYYDLTTLGMYDIRRCEWSNGSIVRSLRFTTGLKRKFHCVLPQPGWCTSRLWEYNGQQYFASAWVYAGNYKGVNGFGVWRVDNNGSLVTVSVVPIISILKKGLYRCIFQVKTAADGNLVCFSEESPVVVYDLNANTWSQIPAELMDDYSGAVVYRPSLRAVT
ncbi:hypothetical protein SELMODRAFT_428742 [Selaginella moellendorffii]|uniref:F-box associated domain-containing protein n=1 Tax=Selaginella moellendorffii TaxID=88036 RepID=D8T3U6_SELML|nr:hypothetical protein SELMODRAFT_428742 [Selaginella moellendorffii]